MAFPLCRGGQPIVHFNRSFRCSAGACRKELSLRKFTIFFGSALESRSILRLGYFWLIKAPPSISCIATGLSDKTVGIYYKHFRTLVSGSLEEKFQFIGGRGIIVEIDESKMGKRKYQRGHHVEGVWILGGVERTAERRVFLQVVENRSAETLCTIIRQCVHPESIIITDLWKAYSSLGPNLGFTHLTVNHSKTFKDPDTGAHTNSIEGTWNGLKMNIASRNRVRIGMDDHLHEFIWRRENASSLWESFVGVIRDMHYTFE